MNLDLLAVGEALDDCVHLVDRQGRLEPREHRGLQGLEFRRLGRLHALQARHHIIHPDRGARPGVAAGAALPLVPGSTVTTTLFGFAGGLLRRCCRLLVHRLGRGRNLGRLGSARQRGNTLACNPERHEMLHQRVESSVLGYDREARAGVLMSETADVERDVEIQCVRAIAADPGVAGVWPERLQRLRQIHRHVFLVLADEQMDPARTRFELADAGRLHVLEIDQEDLAAQAFPQYAAALRRV